MEQKNWAVVRTVVGYRRYDTIAELLLVNEIWALPSQMSNYFRPQRKPISKIRDGAKVTYTGLNPAAILRQIQALTAGLLT